MQPRPDRTLIVQHGILRMLARHKGKFGASRDEIMRGMPGEVGGVSFADLSRALDSLKAQGLVTVEPTGPADFLVKPTPKGMDEARRHGGT